MPCGARLWVLLIIWVLPSLLMHLPGVIFGHTRRLNGLINSAPGSGPLELSNGMNWPGKISTVL